MWSGSKLAADRIEYRHDLLLVPVRKSFFVRTDNHHVLDVDVRKAWEEDFISRLRSFVYLEGVGTGASVFSFFQLGLPASYLVDILVCLGVIALVHYGYRRHANAQLKVHSDFHVTMHKIRDEIAAFSFAPSQYAAEYMRFNEHVANLVADYFEKHINDESICCAIRLAQLHPVLGDVYETVGRSRNMSTQRPEQSKPLGADCGIARILRDKKQKGVYIIRSIDDAIKQGIWEESPNDKLPDVKTLMVCPINGYIGGRKSCLGLLYITSQRDVFRLKHVNLVRGYADFLGLLYPMVTGRLQPVIETKKESGDAPKRRKRKASTQGAVAVPP